MEQNTKTFESLLLGYGTPHGLRAVYEDFLKASLNMLCENPLISVEPVSDRNRNLALYYAGEDRVDIFLELLRQLNREMTERTRLGRAPDIVGEFYEKHLNTGTEERLFHSWDTLELSLTDTFGTESRHGFLDYHCSSGRRLLLAHLLFGPKHFYLGIDATMLFVHMAALNLFLGTGGTGEVMCVVPGKVPLFVASYVFSHNPLHLSFSVRSEDSLLWQRLPKQ